MRIRLVNCAFLLMLCLSAGIQAQNQNSQTVSEWSPQPVSTKPEPETKRTKHLGKTTFTLRSSSSNPDGQTPKVSGGSSTTIRTGTTDGPAINSIVIGPCCDCNRILLDGIFLYQNVTLSLFSSTPNSTVQVTLGHDGPGRIGFATNLNGPYTDSLVFNVTTNSSGNGSLVITFYIKGLDAGQSNMVTTVASGFTNPVPQMEVFACQCPPLVP